MADKPRCTATTKKGKPCANLALDGLDTCLSHAPKEARESRGFGGAQPGAGRPKAPRAVDVLRERIERDVDRVLEPLFDALAADRGLALAIKGGGMEIGYSPDHPTRIQAARELLDRAYGKPKQVQELTGAEGSPLPQVVIPIDQDWQTDVAEALRDMVSAGAASSNGSGHANGNGNGRR